MRKRDGESNSESERGGEKVPENGERKFSEGERKIVWHIPSVIPLLRDVKNLNAAFPSFSHSLSFTVFPQNVSISHIFFQNSFFLHFFNHFSHCFVDLLLTH